MDDSEQLTTDPREVGEVVDAATGLDSEAFRHALGHFASGIVVVTGIVKGAPAGLSCQSFSSLSLDPPLILLCPSRTSSSWPGIAEAGAFCVNVLAADQERICQQFARSGGDKFDGVGWSSGVSGMPRIDGALAAIDCTIANVVDGGDHHVVIGAVRGLVVRTGSPLLFYRGAYHNLPA